jgi:hypothetical protein
MKTKQLTRSQTDIEIVCKQAVQDALILEPKLPAALLAQQIISELEPEVLAELGQRLIAAHFARLIRSTRTKESRTRREQLLLPGFEHLPVEIAISETERVPLRSANYTQVRSYFRLLSNTHLDRRRNDPRLLEAKALMEKMRSYADKQPRITVAEVLGLV